MISAFKPYISNSMGSVPTPLTVLFPLELVQDFIEGIDGIDNGVQQYPSDISPKYRVRTDLSSRVGWLNPAWNESADRTSVEVSDSLASRRMQSCLIDAQERFTKASELTGHEFFTRLDYFAGSWLPARDIVLDAISKRSEVHPEGRIVLFRQFVPWKVTFALSRLLDSDCCFRSISMRLNPSYRSPRRIILISSSIPMKPEITGASRLFLSMLIPLIIGKACPSHGEGLGTMCSTRRSVSLVASLCTRQDLLAVSGAA